MKFGTRFVIAVVVPIEAVVRSLRPARPIPDQRKIGERHRSMCRVARVIEQKLIASCAGACAAVGNFGGASRLAVIE